MNVKQPNAASLLELTLKGWENSTISGHASFKWNTSRAVGGLKKILQDRDQKLAKEMENPRNPQSAWGAIELELNLETRKKVESWRQEHLPVIAAKVEAAKPKRPTTRPDPVFAMSIARQVESIANDPVAVAQLVSAADDELFNVLATMAPVIGKTKEGQVTVRPLVAPDVIERRLLQAMPLEARATLEGLEQIATGLTVLASQALQGLEV